MAAPPPFLPSIAFQRRAARRHAELLAIFSFRPSHGALRTTPSFRPLAFVARSLATPTATIASSATSGIPAALLLYTIPARHLRLVHSLLPFCMGIPTAPFRSFAMFPATPLAYDDS
eukprot:3228562-Rhodomonas_salina.3